MILSTGILVGFIVLPALGLHYFVQMSWFASVLIPVIAFVGNGIVIAFEDECEEDQNNETVSKVKRYLGVRPIIWLSLFCILSWLYYMYLTK